jgi:hypothetical protein
VIAEPDVALTDFALAVECGAFAGLLRRSSGAARWLQLFYAATAVASLAGGVVHGFLPERTALTRVLWAATLLAIGAAALGAWAAAASILLSPGTANRVIALAAAAFAGYATLVLGGVQAFRLAVWAYVPAALLLLVAFGVLFRRTRARPALAGVVGLVVTFGAAWVQQAQVSLHAWLTHNALYHLIQGAALALLFVGARWVARREAC